MSGRTLVVVGCCNRDIPYFDPAHGKGMAVFDFDSSTGGLTLLSERTEADNPNYLAINEETRCVYAVSEVFGWNEGVVSAYRIDPTTGKLSYINKQPALGSITAYASLDQTRKFLLVANYSWYGEPADCAPDRVAAVLPIRPDGGLGEVVASVSHPGKGLDPVRQERSHAHFIEATPDNRHVVVTDLGIDKLMIYRFDADSGALTPGAMPWVDMPPGSGPRHFAFHPSAPFAYLINELGSTVAVLAFDQAQGRFETKQLISTLPPDYPAVSHCSDVHLTPDGRFLYGANRGEDSLSVFSVDPETGLLTFVSRHSTMGKKPRNFAIDPTGRFLIVANQDGDSLMVFRIDAATGKLTDAGKRVEIGTPMCVKFARF